MRKSLTLCSVLLLVGLLLILGVPHTLAAPGGGGGGGGGGHGGGGGFGGGGFSGGGGGGRGFSGGSAGSIGGGRSFSPGSGYSGFSTRGGTAPYSSGSPMGTGVRNFNMPGIQGLNTMGRGGTTPSAHGWAPKPPGPHPPGPGPGPHPGPGPGPHPWPGPHPGPRPWGPGPWWWGPDWGLAAWPFWYTNWSYYYPRYSRYYYLCDYSTSYYDSYADGATDVYANGVPGQDAADTSNPSLTPDSAATQTPPDWPDNSAFDPASSTAYRAQALASFQRGDYRQAARLANHALVDAPQDAKSHEFMSLVLFATGEYRGATMEAHAATALGPVSDWPTLYAYYGDLATYTKHLNALEDYVVKNPSALEGRFLLGYHYMMTGHPKEAKTQFGHVVEKAPRDKAAAALLKQLGGPDTPISTTVNRTPPPAEPKGPALNSESKEPAADTGSTRDF